MRRALLACLLAGGLLLPVAAAAQDAEAEAPAEAPAETGVAPGAPPGQHAHTSPSPAPADRGGEDMRMMTVAMGAMAGYMLIAMPVTLPAIAAGAVGGLAARYWYDRRPVAE